MSWRPVLDGDLAAEARRAVLDIARALARGEGQRRLPGDLALFWAYLAGAVEEPWVNDKLESATAELCAAIGRSPWLHLHGGGLTGQAFALAHISEAGAAEDALRAVDDVLAEALAVERWSGDHDLVLGLAGFGVYAVERGSARLAQRIVDHFAARAVTDGDGVTWFTPPALLAPGQHARWPQGCFNLGLAHGVPGIVAVLGRIAEAGLDPRAHELCTRGLAWLRAQASPDPHGRYATAMVHRNGELAPSGVRRTAWCYGDPGVATAMWSASLRCDTAFDTELAREIAMRAPELCGIEDNGLCHGTIGLAHMFDRWYQASGEAVYRDAARAWIRRGLDGRRADGLGGFAAVGRADEHAATTWRPAADLLEGAAGIALALLAATGDVEPAWDRLLLCDFPAR